MTSSFNTSSRAPGPVGEGGNFRPSQWSSADPAFRKAVSQAEQILEEARVKAMEIEKEAFQKGIEEGHSQGMEVGMHKVEPIAKSLGDACRELHEVRSLFLWQCEKEIVELAMSVARCIVNQEISVKPELVAEVVNRALQEVESTQAVSLHIHPEDLGLLGEAGLADDGSPLGLPSHVQVVKDKSVGRGGCLVRSEMGSIDGRLEEQLSAITARLEDEMEQHRPEPEE